MSETKNGFTKFDTIDEFKTWLNTRKVYRTINKLQVHHTYAPSYDQWPEDEFTRQYNMKKYHMETNQWDNIAQHFTIFPNGKILTGRSLNTTPIGIKGWNTNVICIEIYGNFDERKDIIKTEQKEAVIACYALLCKKFNIIPSIDTIRCHCWFDSKGTYLGDYNSDKSCKTCPGNNFMEIGNSKSAFVKNFYPKVKEYMDESRFYNLGIYRVIVDELNIRKGPGIEYGVVGRIRDKGSYTIVKVYGSWGCLKSGRGWINISGDYCSRVR